MLSDTKHVFVMNVFDLSIIYGEVINIKNKNRNKVNFQNPKVRSVINYLQISENSLCKNDIYKIGSKDIFYQLKNSNYIKETSKGVFHGTKILRNKVEKETGRQFGCCSSQVHSKKILEIANLIPQNVIQNRQFKTGTELNKEFQEYKKSTKYEETTKLLKQYFMERINSQIQQHSQIQESPVILKREKLQEEISNLKLMSELNRSLSIIEESRYLVPDFSFSCSKKEALNFLDKLSKECINVDSRQTELCITNEGTRIERMKEIIRESTSDIITLVIEVITDSYGKEDLERHYLYDCVTSTHTIYI